MDLDTLRVEIDRIDDQLLELFLQRMVISGKVGEYKKANHLPVFQPDREKALLDRREAQAGDMGPYVRKFFQSVIAVSSELQREQGAGQSEK